VTTCNDSKRKVVALAQARMGSCRLPNKMMLHLHGYPVVEWIFRRLSRSLLLDAIIFVIPDSPVDDVLALYLEQVGATVFRGSEDDVLARFYLAAQKFEATHLVRVCCDNPLVSPREIDHLISFYVQNPCDYAYNHIPSGNLYPDGLGAEIVSFDMLETIHMEAKLPSQREHIFNYIWDNRERFTVKTFDPGDPILARPDVKLDLDTWKDYYRLLKFRIYPEISDTEIMTILGDDL